MKELDAAANYFRVRNYGRFGLRMLIFFKDKKLIVLCIYSKMWFCFCCRFNACKDVGYIFYSSIRNDSFTLRWVSVLLISNLMYIWLTFLLNFRHICVFVCLIIILCFMFYVLPENTSIKMSRHSFQVKMHAAFTLGIYSISLGKVKL